MSVERRHYMVRFGFVKYLLKIYGYLRCHIVKSVPPCTLLTASFDTVETSLLLNTSGIRAAAEHAQRISTAMDGGGSTQQQVCIANSKSKNIHGRIFLDMFPLYFG